MSAMSHKDQKRAWTKQVILDAAEAYFIDGGKTNISIRNIAQDIGYSPANIYKYFENKDAIIEALIARRIKEHAQVVAQVDTTGLSTQEALKKGFKAHFNYVLTIPEHYKAMMISDDPSLVNKTQMMDPNTIERLPAQKKLIDTIKQGINQQEIKPVDAVKTTQILWSAMFGLLMRFITEKINDQAIIESFIDDTVDMVFHGIKQTN